MAAKNPMGRPARLKDIAEQCGVTVPTVSRALRDPHRHSPALTEKIRTVARELGYSLERHHAARRLSLRQYGKETLNHLVALALPPHFYRVSYFLAIFEGILDELDREGFGLLTLKNDVADAHSVPLCFARGDVDALLGFPWFTDLLDCVRNDPGFGDRPVVSIVDPSPGADAVVTSDYRQGMVDVVAHLHALGHRRLAYMQRPEGTQLGANRNWASRQRQGLVDGCRAVGLDPDRAVVHLEMPSELWELAFGVTNIPREQRGEALSKAYRDSALPPSLRDLDGATAIVAPNDLSALLLWDLLEQHGIDVPGRVSIVGCDDTDPIPGLWGSRELTTVRLPLTRLGRAAARTVVAGLESEPMPAETLLPVELIVRASTGPAPAAG